MIFVLLFQLANARYPPRRLMTKIPIRAVMNMLGSLVGHGGGFIMDHLFKIILAVVFVLSFYAGYQYTRPQQRVRVNYEHEHE